MYCPRLPAMDMRSWKGSRTAGWRCRRMLKQSMPVHRRRGRRRLSESSRRIARAGDQACHTVERLLHAVRNEPVMWEGQSITVTISIGYVCFPAVGPLANLSLDTAINLADKALYEAKRRARDRACQITSVEHPAAAHLATTDVRFAPGAARPNLEVVELGSVTVQNCLEESETQSPQFAQQA
jgi:hypothetical protein